MRRFSQKNSLVTLHEINITPLLDLAFVLLIIFVITTPLLEQGLDLNLPEGGKPDPTLSKNDVKVVDVSPQGKYVVSLKPMTLAQVEEELVIAQRRNPKLIVQIRGDKKTPFEYVAMLLDRLERRGITQVSLRTAPPSK